MSRRLQRDDWVRAGLLALEQDGVAGVATVPLARALGVTRGSFYWHFESREELLVAVLERWEHEHSTSVIEAIGQVADPRERIRRFAEAATSKPPSIFVQLIYGARTEPAVAAVLERSASARQAALARTYRDLGLTPRQAARRATIAYALYVGLAVLSPDEPSRRALAAELRAILLA